jgi:carbon starvation protein
VTAVVAACVLIAFILGYRYYARYIGTRIYQDQEEILTPAKEFEDGRDYVPTDKHVLFGHHFTSIAGAAPIVGPCVAVYWGWLPGFLWVVLGTIFMGAVHDFGALVVSVREKGRSIADITGKVINSRARLMFLCFVLVLTWLVLAVFAMVIAGLFVSVPSSVLPINVEIIVAIVIGWMIYKKGYGPLIPSIVALGILYLFVWIGTHYPVDLTSMLGWSTETSTNAWIIGLFVYSAIASLLPVWLLLQPRDFINSHQLIVGLAILYLGLFIAHPEFDAPMINTAADGPSIFPLLFVTIACGAISGFHGLVSSGTTSKQISSLSHARPIGYGGMLGEGSLALAAVMAGVAGIALVGECNLAGHDGPVADLNWGVYYDSWANAGNRKASAFVLGGGAFAQELGLSANIAMTLMAVLVISFAATTLDTATRIQRFIVTELSSAVGVGLFQNRYLATVVAVIPAIALAFVRVPNPAGEGTTEAAYVLWPIFGASNQMMAALTMMVLALYFWMRKRPVLPLVLPMLFVMVITLVSLFMQISNFLDQSNWFMVGFTSILLALVLWMVCEGLGMVRKIRSGLPAA